jgi:hypothetical protein
MNLAGWARARNIIEVLAWSGARLYGRPLACNRVLKAIVYRQRDIGPQAVLAGQSTPGDGGAV